MLNQLQADWQLREALRSPLLLNLYPQTFDVLHESSGKAEFSAKVTVEARRKALFAAYLEYFAELETWPAGSSSINDPS